MNRDREPAISTLRRINPGALLTLDIETSDKGKAKYRSRFIGYVPDQYLLLQYPEIIKLSDETPELNQGQEFTVRALIDEGEAGAVITFKAQLIQHVDLPTQALALHFPHLVNLQQLRTETRFNSSVHATLAKDGWDITGKLVDISSKGCRFQMVGKSEQIVQVEDQFTVVISGDHKTLSLAALTCHVKQSKSLLVLGLQFTPESEPQAIELLHRLLLVDEPIAS